jgi:hypothetical protein
MTRRLRTSSAILVCLAAALLLATPAVAAGGPKWKLTITPDATYFSPGTAENPDEQAVYTIEAENVGNEHTNNSQPIILENMLPAGFSTAEVHAPEEYSHYSPSGTFFSVTKVGLSAGASPNENLAESGACPTPVQCVYPSGSHGGLTAIKPGERILMRLHVAIPPTTAEGPIEDRAKISGGGAASVEASAINTAQTRPPFGLSGLLAEPTSSAATEPSSFSPFTQAGGHPFQLTTEVNVDTLAEGQSATGGIVPNPVRDPRDVTVELPPGLIGNPQDVPICSLADFFARECPLSTVVGDVGLRYGGFPFQDAFGSINPVYNLQPSGAYPGEVGYEAQSVPFLVTVGLRSGSDYGLSVTGSSLEEVGINRARFNIWGEPADPAHDSLRGKTCAGGGGFLWFQQATTNPAVAEQDCVGDVEGPQGFTKGKGGPAGVPTTPFLTMPTQCSGQPLAFGVSADNWQVPGEIATAGATQPPVDGCGSLSFSPTIEARPTTNLADAPSGLEFDLEVPQGCWLSEESAGFEPLCQSNLSEAVVKLPQGLSVNPSSGNGLGACSPAQIGLTTPVGETPAHFTEIPAGCPEASALGTAVVDTPLLHNPLKGVVYLATPHQNPFSSLLAAYIVLEGEGLIIKLPGKIEADPQTGQLTGKFLENPQTPFRDFHLDFFGGARGDLRSPATCGRYETTAVLTPYSHTEGGGEEEVEATPIAEPSASFETTEGPQGGSCSRQPSELPNAPVFRAGTESAQAGAFTPFSFRLAREDGSQEIEKIETTLPEGLTAKLAGVSECSEAQLAVAQSREHEGGGAEEQASPACPASSEVGEVQVASGAGPTPLYVYGKAYLAGPYKGAPLSLAIVTPALAGPFDLGDVLVRTALYTAPYNAQIKAVSDPIPHILQGIPLDVRSITLKMARPNFTLNPTDCEEMGFTGSETSLLGNVAPLSQRFQVGGCGALPFKPKLAISLKGGTKRHTFPALTATVTMPPGQANIARAQVTLPHNEQLEQAHITSQVCTQPELASQSCPKASIYGYAKAQTPLLDHPLEGPVYLGVGFGHKLPDLVAELNGQIRVLLHGKVDTGREDGLRNTFEVVPDAPVSKFTLHMFGGKKGLIVNSENLCSKHAKRKDRVLATFTAQNGNSVELEPKVKNSCKTKGHKKRGGGK